MKFKIESITKINGDRPYYTILLKTEERGWDIMKSGFAMLDYDQMLYNLNNNAGEDELRGKDYYDFAAGFGYIGHLKFKDETYVITSESTSGFLQTQTLNDRKIVNEHYAEIRNLPDFNPWKFSYRYPTQLIYEEVLQEKNITFLILPGRNSINDKNLYTVITEQDVMNFITAINYVNEILQTQDPIEVKKKFLAKRYKNLSKYIDQIDRNSMQTNEGIGNLLLQYYYEEYEELMGIDEDEDEWDDADEGEW